MIHMPTCKSMARMVVLGLVFNAGCDGTTGGEIGGTPLPSSGASAHERESATTEKAHVGFDNVVSEGDALTLLREHGVSPTAVHMFSRGLFGTHRSYDRSRTAEELMEDARRRSIEQFTESVKGNQARLAEFSEKHSAEQIEKDPALQNTLRHLLRIRDRFEASLSDVRAGAPIIYSLEVEGAPANLEKLAGDQRLAKLQRATIVNGRHVLTRPERPAVLERYDDGHRRYEKMPVREALTRLSALRSAAKGVR